MADDLPTKIRDDIFEAAWADLAPHFARGGLLVASADLDLFDAALAVARDDTAVVQRWLQSEQLRRAIDADGHAWAASSPRFRAVILQPWVLVQVIAEGPDQGRPEAPLQ